MFSVSEIALFDNGKKMISKAMKKFCETSGILLHFVPVYYARDNQIERSHRVIKLAVAKFLSDQRLWVEVFPIILFAMRTVKSEATGFSPAYLTFGRELRIPQNVPKLESKNPLLRSSL